ncbi:MAG: LacI family DNA-binding transcriptional regulator [Acidobacteriaceae bacterium]
MATRNKMRSKTTISDVAREAGVAKMTVSRVINGGIFVSPAMQKRVQQAIEKLDFRPNEAARMLKGQRARTIGLIVPNLADTFFARCANAVQEVATKQGYMTLIQTASRDPEVELNEIEMMTARNIAGLILVPMQVNADPYLLEIQAAGLPIVILDRAMNGLRASEVMVENAEGAEKAVRHLIAHGHSEIGCIGYDTELTPVQQRIVGYANAMKDVGLVPQIWKMESWKSISGFLTRKLESAAPPTALFSLNNVTSVHVLQTLQQKGIRVPQEIAVAGFDDLDLASLLSVPITAVQQSAHELGRTGAKLLFDHIHSGCAPKDAPISKLVLPTKLIIRNSCGCNGAFEKD